MSVRADFYTDPMCIWALVAEPKIDALEEEYGDRLEVQHRVLPLFGSIDRRFADGGVWAKAGVPGRIASTAKVAAQGGFPTVTGRCWEHAPPSSWSPSLVVTATRQLEDERAVGVGATRSVLRGLRHAFFLDDRNICRRDVQRDVVDALGLPTDSVFALLDDGRAMARLSEAVDQREALRLDGSPTWLFDGGRSKLFGNVDMRVLRATVQALLDGEESGCSTC
jgi:predicted DsbA family dithiol-disulfide isomerase